MMKRIIVVQYLANENNNNQYQELNQKLTPYLLIAFVKLVVVICQIINQTSFIYKQFKVQMSTRMT